MQKVNRVKKLKKDIINIGELLWQKELVAACSGNISLRKDRKNILITTHNCCLGMLCENDITQISLYGKINGHKQTTMEKPVHMAIHRNFFNVAVIHAHPAFTTGYFTVCNKLDCLTFESRILLGDAPCINQYKETITNLGQVIKALKKSKIVVLKRHGVIAIGDSPCEAFFRIQLLEDAVKINLAAKIFSKK
ncbi:MAG: class II aldolase/adducin family protein [Candidatus Omnitrophota bacterium]